jgi:membrane protein DedA with SNARE-associated domain
MSSWAGIAQVTGLASAGVTQGIWQWILRLGPLGFLPLGLVDASVIPVPGSMDVLLIVLAASHREWWPYYAAFATLGAVIGGWVTYRVAHKGGEEALGKKNRPQLWRRVEQLFARSGFTAIAISAILPPPVPLVPFLMAAGAARYPPHKFLLALSFGRLLRYTILGFLAARYSQAILDWIVQLDRPLPIAICASVLILGCIALIVYLRRRQSPKRKGAN